MASIPPLPGAMPTGPAGPMPSSPAGPPPVGSAPKIAGPASMALNDVNSIITSSRNIAAQFPTTVPIVTQINNLVQELIAKIIQSSPPTEPMTPPI